MTKSGDGTLVLSAANTYSGGTTLSSGTLQVENAAALGTGTLTFTGDATLRGNANVTLGNDITGVSGVSPTISAAAGTELTLAPNAFRYQGGAGTTLRFGTATDTGTVTVGITGFAGPTVGGAASIDGGTLHMGNVYTALDLLDSLDGGTNIASGATLERIIA